MYFNSYNSLHINIYISVTIELSINYRELRKRVRVNESRIV